MPAAARSSTRPATSGVSGPTTTSSIARARQKAMTATGDRRRRASTSSAHSAMPGLPGAAYSFGEGGDWAIFQASACSRPPEPMRRTFIAGWHRTCGSIHAGSHSTSTAPSAVTLRPAAKRVAPLMPTAPPSPTPRAAIGSTGFCPTPWRPYARLARLDRPIGWWLLLLPCWWSSALAADAVGQRWPDPWHLVLFLDRRHRHARRRLHLQRHRRPRHRREGRAHAGRGRSRAAR